MLFAADVLERNPGAVILYDVKCTGHLPGQILRHGGSPLMWKTGHSLIKAKMRETDAELAGEMSGHFFFSERWYGFDDGIYAAARLLEILAAQPTHAERDPGRAAQRRVDAGDQGRRARRRSAHASSSASATRRSSKARACRPSTACASTGRTAGAWCARPTPRRCWCCASTPTAHEALARIKARLPQPAAGAEAGPGAAVLSGSD